MAVVKLTAENFEKEVLQSEKPVLVDFYADWCGPCQMMGPVVEEISNEVNDAKVCKINIDEQMSIAQKYGVMSIPTFIVFKNGDVADKKMGAMPKSAVLSMLGQYTKRTRTDF